MVLLRGIYATAERTVSSISKTSARVSSGFQTRETFERPSGFIVLERLET